MRRYLRTPVGQYALCSDKSRINDLSSRENGYKAFKQIEEYQRHTKRAAKMET